MKHVIQAHIEESIKAKTDLLDDQSFIQNIERIAKHCFQAIVRGNKIIFAGNGGSAADSQHLAAELLGRFEAERESIASVALTTNSSAITAIANDYSYEQIFCRQLSGIGKSGDIFIGISTSGNSKNILLAIEKCKRLGISTIGLVGTSGAIPEACDYSIQVPSKRTAIIQESHIMIGHILCGLIESQYIQHHSKS